MYSIDTMPVVYKYYPEFDPSEYPYVKAISYDGMTIGTQKTRVFAYIGFPEQVVGPVPAVVLVHGGGGHASAQWVAEWNARGFAAISMDTTGFYPDTQVTNGWHYGLYGSFKETDYVDAPTNDGSMAHGVASDVEQNWLYHAVADAIIARKILADQANVASDKIGICGISWGGIITSLVIGYDSNFAFAVSIYGSGYLTPKYTLGSIAKNFTQESVRNRWLAENRFANVKIPVLWLCWNDDNNFSIQANTCSYLDTCDANEKTRLSIVHNMGHGGVAARKRPESILFASAAVTGNPTLPKLLTHPVGRQFTVDVDYDKDFIASVYYITSPMTYSVHSKFSTFGSGKALTYMDQEWCILPCDIEKLDNRSRVKGCLPENAAGYYIEIKTEIDGEEFIVSSGYTEI